MATFLLLRHGNNDWIGKTIAGRLPGVHLNAEGREQADRAARHLARRPIHRIVSSPLDRTLETAAPLAAALSLPVAVDEAFSEAQFGEWEGMTVAELERQPLWPAFHNFRGGVRAPGGELAIETQQRMVSGLDRLRAAHPKETIVIVSHADPIRTALAYYLGMSLDLIFRLEIRPGSLSELELNEDGARVLGLNYRCEGSEC